MNSDHKEAAKRTVVMFAKAFGWFLATFIGAGLAIWLINLLGAAILLPICGAWLLWIVYSTVLEEVRKERRNEE